LVSVPYQSPLRSVVSLFKRDRRRVTEARAHESRDAGRRFFQYAFTTREFERILAQAGFHVVRTQGYAIYFGLMELPLAGWALEKAQRRRTGGSSPTVSTSARSDAAARGSRPSLFKRLAVSEDVAVPVAGTLIRALRGAVSNMMMYVCRPANEDRSLAPTDGPDRLAEPGGP
jgi:hypothetical protein